MASRGTQLSDNHIVTVAGHGVDPSPVPPEPPEGYIPSGSGSSGKKSDGNRFAHARKREGEHFSWKDLLTWFGIPVLLVLFVRIFLLGAYTIPSGSMLDTIHIGDYVITSKLTPRIFPLHRGDVVVFEDPAHWLSGESTSGATSGNDLIKRLIGLPGDTVECNGPGEPIVVNGVPVHESAYIRPGVDPSSFPFKVKVTEGHVFVLGDNRANSADSRYHRNDGDDGLVPISKIEGVAVFRTWPFDRIGLLDDHHDAFDSVPDRPAK